MPYSTIAMFLTHGIPSFYELLRKCIYNFSERFSSSSNSNIKACLSENKDVHSHGNYATLLPKCSMHASTKCQCKTNSTQNTINTW